MSGKDLSSISRTNWAALEAGSDENIDYSDIPPLTESFFEKASLRMPANQAHQLVQIDADILQWFQSQGDEYKRLINSALRHHIEMSDKQSAG
jgi:uncharacterized protein (DUF4415 family)